ncbi:hypothetical protein RIF29_29185 [Crotalaria pallida]|uniref:Uncharacterized protein n=1 Tax=Crotalaria pallida TaxID=3830 RepID=A0AAN9EGF0_CROPI
MMKHRQFDKWLVQVYEMSIWFLKQLEDENPKGTIVLCRKNRKGHVEERLRVERQVEGDLMSFVLSSVYTCTDTEDPCATVYSLQSTVYTIE